MAILEGSRCIEALFFPDRARPCKDSHWGGGCTCDKCPLIHAEGFSLLKLIGYLDHTKTSMEISMTTITCEVVRNFTQLASRYDVVLAGV